MDGHSAQVTAAVSSRRTRQRRLVVTLAGYVLAVLGLGWVVHGVNLPDLAAHVHAINWLWVVPAIACDVASYVCQGARWHVLLRPTGRLPVLRSTQAIYAGLFTNEVAPARLGELVRAYLASRWLARPVSAIVPSMLVERIADGLWMALGVGFAAAVVPLPHALRVAAGVLGGIVVISAAGLAVLAAHQPRRVRQLAPGGAASRGVLAPLRALVAEIGNGLRRFDHLPTLATAAGWSLLLLFFQAAAFWLVMRACGVPLPLTAGLAVFLIVHLGTALPNAPANVGSYQFFTVLGLSLFGIDRTQAAAFSMVAFVVLTAPLWGLGFAAIVRSGLTLSRIRADVVALTSRREKGARDASRVPKGSGERCDELTYDVGMSPTRSEDVGRRQVQRVCRSCAPTRSPRHCSPHLRRVR